MNVKLEWFLWSVAAHVHWLTVVCGEAVDDVHVFPECLHVLTASQHRSDLRAALTDIRQMFLTQEQVMRRHLASDLDALLLCSSDYQDLTAGVES